MPSGPKKSLFKNRHAEERAIVLSEQKRVERERKEEEKQEKLWFDPGTKAQQRQDERKNTKEAKRTNKLEQRKLRKNLVEEEERELEHKPPKKVTTRKLQKEMAALIQNFGKENKHKNIEDSSLKPVNTCKEFETDENVTELGKKIEKISLNNVVTCMDTDQDMINRNKDIPDIMAQYINDSNNGLNKLLTPHNVGDRARVEFKKFITQNMPSIKEKFPGLRKSQYHNKCWELFQKSTQNPFVQLNLINQAEYFASIKEVEVSVLDKANNE